MVAFTVSYDLLQPGKDYGTLIKELRRLRGRKVLLSAWYLPNVDTTAAGLCEHLMKFVDSNDRIFVATASAWAGRHLLELPA